MAASVEVAQKWGGFFKPLVLKLWFPVILYLAGKYNHVQTRQHTRFMLDSTTVIKFMSVWNWNLQCLYTHHSLSPKENYHQALHPHLLDHLTVLKWDDITFLNVGALFLQFLLYLWKPFSELTALESNMVDQKKRRIRIMLPPSDFQLSSISSLPFTCFYFAWTCFQSIGMWMSTNAK